MILIALFCAIHWYRANIWSNNAWLQSLWRFQPSALIRPDVWAAATVQVLFALGIGTNHLMTKTGAAPSEKYNVVWISSMLVCFSGFIAAIALCLVFFAYGSEQTSPTLTTPTHPHIHTHIYTQTYTLIFLQSCHLTRHQGIPRRRNLGDDTIRHTKHASRSAFYLSSGELCQSTAQLCGTYKFSVLHMSQLCTLLNLPWQTMFDNSSSLDGTAPRTWVLSMAFWVGVTALGINCLHNHIEAIVAPMHKSAANWSLGFGRWLCLIIVVMSCILLSIILW